MKKISKLFTLSCFLLCSLFCLTACGSEWYGDNLGGGGEYSGSTPQETLSNTYTDAIATVVEKIEYSSTSTDSVPSEAAEIAGSSKLSTDGGIYYISGNLELSSKIEITASCTIYIFAVPTSHTQEAKTSSM